MSCAIIGAGQLGSRHLQGLLNYDAEKLQVFVVDINETALEIAKARANEINNFHEIIYTTQMNALPEILEFVIVATNSNIRATIVSLLLKEHKIKVLLLEKVLFPNLASYIQVSSALQKTSTACFVNHPRRLLESYKTLKSQFVNNNDKAFFTVVGVNWGLACNGLHYLDLFEYLTNATVASLDTTTLDERWEPSKRNGYFEISGTLKGKLSDGSEFSISSLQGREVVAPAISILSKDNRFYIQEGNYPIITRYSHSTNFMPDEKKFNLHFQSSLTGKILKQFKESGVVDLPDYWHATKTHTIFLNSLLPHYNQFIGDQTNKILPIT